MNVNSSEFNNSVSHTIIKGHYNILKGHGYLYSTYKCIAWEYWPGNLT